MNRQGNRQHEKESCKEVERESHAWVLAKPD